jgi:putative transposase
VGLDHDGYLPTFLSITEGKVHDINVGRALDLPKQGIVVFDRGYTEHQWFNSWNSQGIDFVTR